MNPIPSRHHTSPLHRLVLAGTVLLAACSPIRAAAAEITILDDFSLPAMSTNWTQFHPFAPFGIRGKLSVTDGWDNRVFVWDVERWRETKSLPGSGSIRGLAYTRDGRRLFVSRTQLLSDEGRPAQEVWDPDTARNLMSLDGNPTAYNSTAITPDGLGVFSGDDVGVATRWNAFPWLASSYPGPSHNQLPDRIEHYARADHARRMTHLLRPPQSPLDPVQTIDHSLWPQRDPNTPPECIDLSRHYTALLDVAFVPVTRTDHLDLNYAELPRGVLRFNTPSAGFPNSQPPAPNIPFDIRGAVVLSGWAKPPREPIDSIPKRSPASPSANTRANSTSSTIAPATPAHSFPSSAGMSSTTPTARPRSFPSVHFSNSIVTTQTQGRKRTTPSASGVLVSVPPLWTSFGTSP
ncbi:MAG: hypothetical protein FJ404_10550 [Verrucomicrobia bacterium]|nr:hypothetical protein [Verrucomicrobiota bacterium]